MGGGRGERLGGVGPVDQELSGAVIPVGKDPEQSLVGFVDGGDAGNGAEDRTDQHAIFRVPGRQPVGVARAPVLALPPEEVLNLIARHRCAPVRPFYSPPAPSAAEAGGWRIAS